MTNRYDLLPNERKHVEDTMRLARLLRVVGWLALAAIVCLFLLARMDNTKPAGATEWCDGAGTIECETTTTTAPPVPTTEAPDIDVPVTIERQPVEGDAGWDCATMGNKICGPIAVEVDPTFTG
jgi:hypothetical protein